MSEEKEYPIDLIPFLKNYQRYKLELVPRSDLHECVYIQATPSSLIPGYQFDKDEDSKFNLSLAVGNDDGSFAWGRAAFETSAKNLQIEIDDATNERILVAELQDATGAFKRAELNLDKHLDIVEYVDETSREMMRKLGEKPPSSRRSVVLCFDGTSNHFSKYNTNVVKFVELLKRNDPAKQVVYYQTGVGTYAPPGLMTNAGLTVAAKADEAMAWFLYQHVIDGYKYLMQTYQDGDQISIVGFSRGAYTARALAGMIHSVGLLPKHNIENVPFAYQVYETSTENQTFGDVSEKHSSRPENVNPEDFKRTFCIPIKINFVGVWDTVGSVGAFRRKVLPWIEYNPSIHFFRQALALDENRGNFIPSVWDHSRTDVNYQDVLEVWFKGGHADVGGGAHEEDLSKDKRKSDPLLSNITLRWMVRQCFDLDTGILFDTDAMRRYRNAGVLEQRLSDEGNTERQMRIDHLDALDMIPRPYIALSESAAWKVLEYLPVPKLDQLGERSQPGTVRMPNAGAPRTINYRLGDPIYIHCSVISFLQTPLAKERNYVPAAVWHGFNDGDWPEIDEGLMSSIITDDDEELMEVRKRLKVFRSTPGSQGSWLNHFSWSRGEEIKAA